LHHLELAIGQNYLACIRLELTMPPLPRIHNTTIFLEGAHQFIFMVFSIFFITTIFEWETGGRVGPLGT